MNFPSIRGQDKLAYPRFQPRFDASYIFHAIERRAIDRRNRDDHVKAVKNVDIRSILFAFFCANEPHRNEKNVNEFLAYLTYTRIHAHTHTHTHTHTYTYTDTDPCKYRGGTRESRRSHLRVF